jgi:branched-chain amino acid transport system substrate-binding protein
MQLKLSPILTLIVIPVIILLQACQIKHQRVVPAHADEPDMRDMKQYYSQIIANNPGSIESSESKYRLGLIKLSENHVSDARSLFKDIHENTVHFPWNIAAGVELTGMDLTDDMDTYLKLKEYLEMLQTSDFEVQEPILRCTYYIGVWFFNREEWLSAYDLLRSSGPLSADSNDFVRFYTMTAICLSRLKQFDEAFEVFQKVLDTDHSGTHEALIESVNILIAENNIDRALQLFMKHTHLLTDKTVSDHLVYILRHFSEKEDLENLMIDYRSGTGAFFLRREYVMRLWDEGEPYVALEHLEILEHRFPEYFDSLNRLRSLLESAIHVKHEAIGVLVPVSGSLAPIGHSIYRGAQLAVSDYHDAGGSIPIRLILEDTGETPDTAISGFNSLIDDNNVIAIVGPVRSAITETLLPLCDQRRIVMITPGCPRENIIENSDWVFRLYPSVYYEMQELVRFAVRDLGLFRFGCLYPDIEYGVNSLAAIQTAADEEAATLVFHRDYKRDLSDLRQTLNSLSDTATDVIVIADQSERAAIVAGHVRYEELLTPTIAGLGAWENPDLLEAGGVSLESSFFVTSYPFSTDSRLALSQRFLTRYGEHADSFALRSYETLFLLLSAIDEGVRFRTHLHQWLRNEEGLNGLDGRSRFSETGDYEPPVTVFKIHDSKYFPWRMLPIRHQAD